MESLFNYYETKDIRPTYAAFKDEGQLERYAEQRKNFFYRLNLPYTFFNGKNLLEFGPDTGENALVFAKWGSSLTLIEPIMDAHTYIRNYFSKYKLENNIIELVSASLLEFQPNRKYDIIDAEGFIYTIQPNTDWIKKAKECLNQDGLFIISFLGTYGGFFELLLKAIYQSIKRSGKYGEGVETAKKIFLNKWNSIEHTRSIESWFMDVIENPFVRLKYYIDPIDLLKDMHQFSMRLYSSWPVYRDPNSVDWIKKPFTAESELESSISFIRKSSLSQFLGKKCFMTSGESEIEQKLSTIVSITDMLIEQNSIKECKNAIELVGDVKEFIKEKNTFTSSPDNLDVNVILDMIQNVFNYIGKNEVEELIEYCNTNETFIRSWGSPTQNVIFQNC